MQALPFAAGALLLATVTLNAANPKRNKPSKISGAGTGTFGSSGPGVRQINNNRAMNLSSQEFGGSLSSARRSPKSQSFSRGNGSSRHTRAHSLNRNVPHTPSATTSMGEILHSRNPSTGMAQNRRTWGQQAGQQAGPSRDQRRVQRKPGHQPSQSLPDFSYPGAGRDARKPTFTNANELLGHGDPGSENRDQRLPVTLF